MAFRALLVGVLAIVIGLYYKEIGVVLQHYQTLMKNSEIFGSKATKVWYDEHLVKYKHLAVFGHVFDVSSAPKFYGEKGHYNGFTGADTTRAFATSDLSGKSFMSTVDGLGVSELQNAFEWLDQFKAKYPLLGVLQGLYFDSSGRPTAHLNELREAVRVHAQTLKSEEELYPHCNVASSGDDSEVDCTTGFAKDRFPRLFSTSAQPEPRCACLTRNYLNTGRASVYPGCSEYAHRCRFKVQDVMKLLEKFKGS